MKDLATVVGIVLVAVSFLGGLSVGGYYLYAFLAPKYESTRRDVMIESRVYSEGVVRELYALQRQYQQAGSDTERATIAAAARHQYQIFPQDRLPADLRLFMTQVGG